MVDLEFLCLFIYSITVSVVYLRLSYLHRTSTEVRDANSSRIKVVLLKMRALTTRYFPWFTDKHDESGFSLAEVMVAAALLGGLSLSVMRVVEMQALAQRKTEIDMEISSIVSAINQNLLNDESCEYTMQEVGRLSVGASIDGIRNRADKIILEVGKKYGGNRVLLKSIKIAEMNLSSSSIPAGSSVFGEMTILVTLEKMAKKINGAKVITKKFTIRVEVDSDMLVLRCYSATENAIDTSKVESCRSIGGTFNNNTGMCKHVAYNNSSPDISDTHSVSTKFLESYLSSSRGFVRKTGDSMTGDLSSTANVYAANVIVTGEILGNKVSSNSSLSVGGELTVKGASVIDGGLSVKSAIYSSGAVEGNSIVSKGTIRADGNISAGGTITASSDRRLKNSITHLEDSLEKISKIDGVSFYWNRDYSKNRNRQIGVIAQNVKEIYPELVESGAGHLKVNYMGLVGPVIESIKEIKIMLQTQKRKLDELENIQQRRCNTPESL